MSSSLPSSRETPSEPFGRPIFLPEDLAFARPSRVRPEIRSRSTSANSAKSVVMTLVWMSRLPSTRMFSLSATEDIGDCDVPTLDRLFGHVTGLTMSRMVFEATPKTG